jgi:hypothetical protein
MPVSRKQPELYRNSSCSSSYSTVVDSPESKWTNPTRSTIPSFRLTFNTIHTENVGIQRFLSRFRFTTGPPKGPFCTPTVRTVTPNSAGGYWKESRCIHRRTLAYISHRLADWHEISIWTHIQLATEL